MSHHYDPMKVAIGRATKAPPMAHKRLRDIYNKRSEKVNYKLESFQLSKKDQISTSRLSSGHHTDLIYWHHKIARELDTVCRKCEMGRRLLNMQLESVPGFSTLQSSYMNST